MNNVIQAEASGTWYITREASVPAAYTVGLLLPGGGIYITHVQALDAAAAVKLARGELIGDPDGVADLFVFAGHHHDCR